MATPPESLIAQVVTNGLSGPAQHARSAALPAGLVSLVSKDNSGEGWSEVEDDEDDIRFYLEQRPPHHG